MKSKREVAQSCLTLHGPMDCSPPGSSMHRVFQARVLEWFAIAFSEEALRSLESFPLWIHWFSYMIFLSSFCVTYLTNSEDSCSLIQCVITEFSLPQFPPRHLLDSLDLQISGKENLIGQAWDKVLPASYGQPFTAKGKGPCRQNKATSIHSYRCEGNVYFLGIKVFSKFTFILFCYDIKKSSK